MTTQFSSEKIDLELSTLTSFSPAKVKDKTPFRIAILSDFSGRGNRGLGEISLSLASGKLNQVDVDKIDELPAKLGVEIHVPIGNEDSSRIAIRFDEMDDFHPDRIFERLDVFQELKAIRKRLQNPTTFAEAASQVRRWVAGEPDSNNSKAAEVQNGSAELKESDSDTIERLLGKKPEGSARQFVDLDKLIHEIVKPYIVPAPHPQQAELVAQIDQTISSQMRALLHNPDFKELEAAWSSLHFLVNQIQTDENLKLYIGDISKAELEADLSSTNQIKSSGIYRLLVEQSTGTQGAEPWAILVGCYTFDKTAEDVDLLRGLGQLAHVVKAPFLSSAGSHFAGCESIALTPDPDNWQWQADSVTEQRWQELRNSFEASSIGLVLPRLLLRLPYGKNTEPIYQFDFNELSDCTDHEEYLWGNPAIICACLLAEAFGTSGWSLTGALQQELIGLPIHVYKSKGETCVTPCAETILTERAMQKLIEKGLMPLLSIKGRDAVRIARFQSIAKPNTPLAGRWK
ncbi:MAG: type VI secretion system contractile sheath large subunit [Sedimentisphaerales bacterium]|nr:type VI secretion system contractile sheath large subunit [Sedimentisphaerales bacterium]